MNFGHYASSSLGMHLAVFLLPYSLVYSVFYWWRPNVVSKKKLSKEKYPPATLVSKEIQRCLLNIFVLWAIDLVVMGFVSKGFLQTQLLQHEKYESGWMPDMEDITRSSNILLVCGLVIWSDAHFYFSHRLLHEVPFLYKHIHKIHHESYNPDTFSGLSFHPLEGVIYFSSTFAFLLIPYPIWAYHIHRLALIIAPISGHTAHGPEYDERKPRPWMFGDPADHWIHHTKFNYNFGSGILPRNGIWDNLLGTAYKGGSVEREKAAAEQSALASGYSRRKEE